MTTLIAVITIIIGAFGINLLKPTMLSAKIAPLNSTVSNSNLLKTETKSAIASAELYAAESPLYFEENIGQEPEHVLFTSVTPNYKIALHKNRMDLLVNTGHSDSERFSHLHIIPQGMNLNAHVSGINPLPGYSNYFTGSNRSQWFVGARHYTGIRYESVYPGIDLDFYGNSQEIEYDFIVSPGSDPEKIRLAFAGVDKLELDSQGNAVLQFQGGQLIQKRPYVYQKIDGRLQEVAAEYRLLQSNTTHRTPQLGFSVRHWDKNHPLIIDPILSYSKRLGGDLNYTGGDLAIDDAGYLYVLGRTYSHAGYIESDTSLAPCYDACQADVLISKFSPDKKTLLWKSILTGSGDDDGRSLKIDSRGRIYVAGWTSSDDFPRRRAHDWTFGGESEGFLSHLTEDGKTLIFSTFVGNNESEIITSMDLAEDGSIYLAGRSSRLVADEKKLHASIDTNGFVRKYSESGQTLLYNKRLGGKEYDSVESIAVSDQLVYVAGSTDSLKWQFETAFKGKRSGASDGFISALSPVSGKPVFITLLGGKHSDIANSVHVTENGNVVVAGISNSGEFSNVRDAKYSKSDTTDWDAFVSRISSDGEIQWTRHLAGSNNDYATDIITDKKNNIYLSGYTYSNNLTGLEDQYPIVQNEADLFISKMPADGTGVAFTKKLGGPGDDRFGNIVKHPQSGLIVSGISFGQNQQFYGDYRLPLPDFSYNGVMFFATVSDPLLYPVPDLQWTPFSLPRKPSERTYTISEFLGDNISGSYGETWFVYQYHEKSDTYRLLKDYHRLEPGLAYWLLQNTGETVFVDLPAALSEVISNSKVTCESAYTCLAKIPPENDRREDLRYIGNPLLESIKAAHIRLITDHESFCSNTTNGCSLPNANQSGRLKLEAWVYRDGKKQWVDNQTEIAPLSGFWIRAQPELLKLNPRMLFRGPGAISAALPLPADQHDRMIEP